MPRLRTKSSPLVPLLIQLLNLRDTAKHQPIATTPKPSHGSMQPPRTALAMAQRLHGWSHAVFSIRAAAVALEHLKQQHLELAKISDCGAHGKLMGALGSWGPRAR